MWRAIASNALTMLVVGLFLMGGLILWGQSQYKAEGPLETAICLQVRSGSNMTRCQSGTGRSGRDPQCNAVPYGCGLYGPRTAAESR